MFQENMLPLSSSSKNKPIKKPGWKWVASTILQFYLVHSPLAF
jgi:hypothetical protein